MLVDFAVQNMQSRRAPNWEVAGQEGMARKATVGKGVDRSRELLLKKGSTLIKIAVLLSLLVGYPDRKAAEFLAAGFTEGFRILAPSLPGPSYADNLRSVRGLEDMVWKKVVQEVAAG